MTTTTMACAMQMKSRAAKIARLATTTLQPQTRRNASLLQGVMNAKAIPRMVRERSMTSTRTTMACAMPMKSRVVRIAQLAITMLLLRIPPRVFMRRVAMCVLEMPRMARVLSQTWTPITMACVMQTKSWAVKTVRLAITMRVPPIQVRFASSLRAVKPALDQPMERAQQ